MPAALRHRAYRIYFYSHEPDEPPHVHIDRDNLSAKFGLSPVSLASNLGFGARELRQVERIARDRQAELLGAWNGYFGAGGR
jgi:Domain of unknown function (DUF4160)